MVGMIVDVYKRQSLWLPNNKTIFDPCPIGWRVPPDNQPWKGLQAGSTERCHTDSLHKLDEWKRVPEITMQVPAGRGRVKMVNPMGP